MRETLQIFCLILLSWLLLLGRAEAGELRGIYNNNLGVSRFASKRPVDAYNHFDGAMTDLPFSAQVHYNMGTVFLANKEYEKAISEFGQALRLLVGKNPATLTERERALQFQAFFDSAVALTELKRPDEALQAYQMALEIVPNSVEVKTNIELLTKQDDGGGQGGEQKDKKDQKDKGDKGQDQQKDKPKDQQQTGPTPKPSPRPFKSEELSQQDVGRILEELKRQEDQIRAKMQRDGAKDAPHEKDW